ncbi:hypothetical protein WJX82_008919 [Trebouxia sp. C0006]
MTDGHKSPWACISSAVLFRWQRGRVSNTHRARHFRNSIQRSMEKQGCCSESNGASIGQAPGRTEAAVCMTICHPSVVQTHLCVLEQLPAAQQYLDRLHGLQENRQVAELLADFGMCTRLQSPGSCQGAFTGDHAVAHGTLMYMPPELLLHGTVSCAVDVYSLSILLWEIYANGALKSTHVTGQV